MSSPEEVESFKITDRDLEDEFNIDRPQFRQTKNQATYGIWADDSDDDIDDKPGFGRSKKKKGKDYAAPISFVTGGVKVSDKKKSEDEEHFTSDEDEPIPKPKKITSKQPTGSAYKKTNMSSVGGWEKHTRGIGSKLMEKMGFMEGKGLGKNLQGKSTIVEAKLRKGKGAVGFYGSESKSTPQHETVIDSEEEEDKDFVKKMSQWKRKPNQSDQKKKLKYIYKTADEIIAGGDKKKKPVIDSKFSKVKVIDMTGKEKRVTKGYHSISQKHDKPDEDYDDDDDDDASKKPRAFDMPELLHNLDLLVKMAEDEIISNNAKLNYESDLLVNLKHEEERLNTLCEQEEIQLNKMTNILEIVEACEKRMMSNSTNPLTLDDCAEIFHNLLEEYYQEYQSEIKSLAISVACPLMRNQLMSWKPLDEPRRDMETIQVWRALLEESHKILDNPEEDMDPFEHLIWEAWMPSIRVCINKTWNPRQPESLIILIEAWKPIIPNWIFNNILDQLIMPLLQNEVDEWNPLIDTMPIHAWIHPWLLILGNRLEILYGPMRNKLANALTNWHPSDPSAKMMLTPWRGVWIGGHMDAFLVKNIAPKLNLCMDEFIINTHKQHLDAWNWVISWIDLLPIPTISKIIEKHFFPKWHHALYTWLTANPNYDEVTNWFMGWTKMFPESLANSQNIREQFNNALDLIDRSVSGNLHADTRKSADNPITNPQTNNPKPLFDKKESAKYHPSVSSVPTSHKELIERKAEERGILFLPLQNRHKEGRQIYQFGSLQIYLDRGVIFYFNNGQWFPSSLNKLLEMVH